MSRNLLIPHDRSLSKKQTHIPQQRKNSNSIKRMLANVLGHNRESYWDHLRLFLIGTLTKSEFDSRVIHFLDSYSKILTFFFINKYR